MNCWFFIIAFFISGNISHAQLVPAATGSRVGREQAQAALDFHNKARKDVGVAPLEWSDHLSSFAQAWADNLAADGCKIKHRPFSGDWAQKYGENIYYSSGAVTLLNAAKAWYNEINDYKHEKLTVQELSKVGHYTQIVSRRSTRMGIGLATCPSGATIVVANYSPMGNYIGQKPY